MEVESGRLKLRVIKGMTIEERAASGESLPASVFEEIKKCNVLLKGSYGDAQSLRSVAQPGICQQLAASGAGSVCSGTSHPNPEKKIDWTFFRENIEGEYIWGNKEFR